MLIEVMVRDVLPALASVVTCGWLVTPTGWKPKFKFVGVTPTNVPVPVSETVCGLPPPLSTTLRAAVFSSLRGVKVTLMVQLLPAGTRVPQVLVWAKAPGLLPVKCSSPMLKLWVLVFVKVTVWGGLVVPTNWVAKVSFDGDSATTVPTPVSGTTCGLLEALSTKVTLPVNVPIVDGVKVTAILQLASAGVELQFRPRPTALKFALAVMLVTVSGVPPLLVRIIVWAGLVEPTSCIANVRLDGESAT